MTKYFIDPDGNLYQMAVTDGVSGGIEGVELKEISLEEYTKRQAEQDAQAEEQRKIEQEQAREAAVQFAKLTDNARAALRNLGLAEEVIDFMYPAVVLPVPPAAPDKPRVRRKPSGG